MKTFSEKKVAAVLFTDIEGYSLVSNQNQQRGLEMARIHREVIQFCVAIYGGECINFYGDGSLSLFSDAKDAVSCAIQMQHRFRLEGGIPVRIGIHAGEVVCDAGSAYGDTVNIASRIQNIAPKGGILFSGEVYRSIGRPGSYRAVGIGSENLKNIPFPIKLYYVDHPDVSPPEKGEVHRRAVAKHEVKPKKRTAFVSVLTLIVAAFTAMAAIFIDTNQPPDNDEAKVAVLPFYNLTGNPDDSVIGIIAANKIIKSISELPGTVVVNYDFLNSFDPENKTGAHENEKAPWVAHAQNLILGKYFRERDSIVFKAEMISLETKRFIHLWKPQKSPYKNPMEALGKIERAIIEYLASREQPFHRIPSIEAGDAFMKAIDIREPVDSLFLGYHHKIRPHGSPLHDRRFSKTGGHGSCRIPGMRSGRDKLVFQKSPPVIPDGWAGPPPTGHRAGLESAAENKQCEKNGQLPANFLLQTSFPSSEKQSCHMNLADRTLDGYPDPTSLDSKINWPWSLSKVTVSAILPSGFSNDKISYRAFKLCT